MKILHIVSSLNVGGAERFVIDLAYEQRQRNNTNVEILSMGKPSEPLESELINQHIKIHYGSSISQLKKIFSSFEIIHIHSSYCLLRSLLASFFMPKVKVVYTRHNERVHCGFKWRIIYMLAQLKLHKMIFVAEKAKQNYLSFYPQFANKAQVILNGVLPVKTMKIFSNKIRLGHIGRFVPLKSQHNLIKAVALLPKELRNKLSMNFFGTGELLETNRKLATNLTPNVDVTFSGFIADRDEIFKQIDILVVTSETEGLSLAILEALTSGTPIIASDVGGNPELVHPYENGFLYPYHNIRLLAKAIENLATDQTLYQKFSSNCQRFYLEKFSMQRCAAEYIESYQ